MPGILELRPTSSTSSVRGTPRPLSSPRYELVKVMFLMPPGHMRYHLKSFQSIDLNPASFAATS